MERLRALGVILILVLLAAACSSTPEPTLSPAPSTTAGPTTTTDPGALAFSEDEPEDEPTGPRPLRIGIPDLRIVPLDQLDESNPTEILIADLLTDGLTERDPETGHAAPALAETWTTDDDFTSWSFVLGDATFGDGTPIVADDVVDSLNAIARRGNESLSGPSLSVIRGYDDVASGTADAMTGVVALDDRTVAFGLTEPYAPLADLLSAAIFGVQPVDDDVLPASSSQRWVATELLDDGLVLAPRNPDDRFERLELMIDAVGLRLGVDTDLTVGIDPAVRAPLGRDELWFNRSADVYLAVNGDRIATPLLRHTLFEGIDQDELVDTFFAGAVPMRSIVPESVPGGSADACGSACDDTPLGAQTDGELFVDFFVVEGDDREQRLAESIASQLRSVGFNVAARAHPVDDYGRRIADGELDIFRFGSVGAAVTADAELVPSFASWGRDNVTETALVDFDALIDVARKTGDPDARAAVYAAAEQLVWENTLILPIATLRHRVVLGPDVADVEIAADGSIVLPSVEFAG